MPKEKKQKENLIITQEVFDLNVDYLTKNGVEVGDEVELTAKVKKALKFPEAVAPVNSGVTSGVASAGKKATKVVCPIAILRGDEFVRVYPEGSEEQAAEFLSKNYDTRGVDPDSLSRITVSWRENEKKKDDSSGRMVETGNLVTRLHVFTPDNGEDWFNQARSLANEGQRRSCVAVTKGL